MYAYHNGTMFLYHRHAGPIQCTLHFAYICNVHSACMSMGIWAPFDAKKRIHVRNYFVLCVLAMSVGAFCVWEKEGRLQQNKKKKKRNIIK